MWMTDPKIMCRKHLLGEHVEIHMFIGTIKRNKRITGYIENNLIEMTSLLSRHKELADEMKRRGMNHKTDIDEKELKKFMKQYDETTVNYKIDRKRSKKELLKRCNECGIKQKSKKI